MTTDKIVYSIKRSNRKTIAIRFEFDGTLTVLAPMNSSKSVIDLAVQSNADWIRQKADNKKRLFAGKNNDPITKDQIEQLISAAKSEIPARIDAWACRLGVSYNRLSIKKLLTRWGSCSVDSNISINCLLMLAPEYVIDYILVHELSHIKYMDHSKSFYSFLDAHFPYRKESQLWLKNEGALIVSRARRGGDE